MSMRKFNNNKVSKKITNNNNNTNNNKSIWIKFQQTKKVRIMIKISNNSVIKI